MRPSVTSATRWPRSCSTPSGGVSLCSSGMPLARGPWKRTTATKSRSSSPALNARVHRVLVVEHARRRLDRHAVLGLDRRDLDRRARPRLPVSSRRPPSALERLGHRAQHRRRRRSAPAPARQASVPSSELRARARSRARPSPHDGADVGVQQAGVEQFADHEAHAAGGVEVVHVGRAVGIDARQQRHRAATSSSKSSQSMRDAGGARDGDQVDACGWSSRRWRAGRRRR